MRAGLNVRQPMIGAPNEIGRTIGRVLIVMPRYCKRAFQLSLKLAHSVTLAKPAGVTMAAARDEAPGAAPNGVTPAPSTEQTATGRRGQQPPGLLLEAETDGHAAGIFLVENARPERVCGQLGVSGFADGMGRRAGPTISFSPSEISLEPGEQVLVHVAALIDQSFEPEVRYLAEVSIPGLSHAGVSITVRRRASEQTDMSDPRYKEHEPLTPA
jgi:hypothetical protein